MGRYDGRKAHVPGEVAKAPLHVRTAVGRVPDPYSPGQFIAATINRRVDILEQERSQKRISEAAYQAGRIIQSAFEPTVSSSSNWVGGGGVGDPTTAQELRVLGGCVRAQRAVALEARLIKAVGEMGAGHLERILGRGWSFRDVAADEGRLSERGVAQVAGRFRSLLEDIADHWAAKGVRKREATADLR